MAKLTLDDLSNLQNESSAVGTINSNNAAVEAALEKTLSRDGTSPNSMGASLDMNSNRIINLPEPVSDSEPVRKGEFDATIGDAAQVQIEVQALRDETEGFRDEAEADKIQTGLDRIATAADVVLTHADVVLTHADVASVVDRIDELTDATDQALIDIANAAASALTAGDIYLDTTAGLAATTNGQYFHVPSAVGEEYTILYKNVAGVATEIKRYPSVKAIEKIRSDKFLMKCRSALKDNSMLKLLVTRDGVKTFKTNYSTSINTIADLTGNYSLVQPAINWTASAPSNRPELTATGILLNPETGFDINSAVLVNARNFSVDLAFKIPALAATFNTKADLDAARVANSFAGTGSITAGVLNVTVVTSGTLAVGQWIIMPGVEATKIASLGTGTGGTGTYNLDTVQTRASVAFTAKLYAPGSIFKVINDVNTTDPVDVPAKFLQHTSWPDTALVNGYYIENTAGLANPINMCLIDIAVDSTNAGGKYLRVKFGRQGFFTVEGYDGTSSCNMSSFAVDAFGAAMTKTQHIRLEQSGNNFRLRLNGEEIYANRSALTLSGTNRLWINGQGRTNGTAGGLNGASWELIALGITVGQTRYKERKALSDVFAQEFGTPLERWSPVLRVAAFTGQSNEAGITGAGVADPYNGWDGSIIPNPANSGGYAHPNQVFIPGVYVSGGMSQPQDIGPLLVVCAQTAGAPSVGGGNGLYSLGAGETLEWGLMTHVRQYNQDDWCLFNMAVSSQSMPALSDKSVPPRPFSALRKGPATASSTLTYRELMLRQAQEIMAFAAEKDQTVVLELAYNGQGENTAPLITGAVSYGNQYQIDFEQRLIPDLLYIFNQSHYPMVYKKNIDLSGNQVSSSNVSPSWNPDQIIQLEANRSKTFDYYTFGEAYARIGTILHPAYAFKIKQGEMLGHHFTRMRYVRDGTYTDEAQGNCFKVKSVIWSGTTITLTLSEAAQLADTQGLNVPQRHTTGGVDTYGFVFIPNGGGRTITNVDLTNMAAATPTIVITISGTKVTGDRLTVTGLNARWSNIKALAARTGLLPALDETTTLVGGKLPYNQLGTNNDLTPFLAPTSHVAP